MLLNVLQGFFFSLTLADAPRQGRDIDSEAPFIARFKHHLKTHCVLSLHQKNALSQVSARSAHFSAPFGAEAPTTNHFRTRN